MNPVSADEISTAMATAIATGRLVQIRPYRYGLTLANESCMLLKPELTALGPGLGPVWDVIMSSLTAFDQEIVGATVVDAQYLVRHKIMNSHYGVIDSVSRGGVAAISDEARLRLETLFRDDLPEARIYGGHQFIREYPFFTAPAAAVFYDNLRNVKLAGGTHSARAVVKGHVVIILNGFHPEQLERFTTPGTCIVALALRGQTEWKAIRQAMTGATFPDQADARSIRGQLFRRKAELGLTEVSPGLNGVHVSAGPLEGAVEICRYMSDHDAEGILDLGDTTFGHSALSSGISVEALAQAARNEVISGKPAFDLTEETDAAGAIEMLRVA